MKTLFKYAIVIAIAGCVGIGIGKGARMFHDWRVGNCVLNESLAEQIYRCPAEAILFHLSKNNEEGEAK